MSQWVIFGFGNYISDIFDIIQANRGTIKSIVCNITPTPENLANLKRRIDLLRYNVPIIDLADFHPQKNDKFCCGFIHGRDKLVSSLKHTNKIEFSSLIHPTAYLGCNVSCGEGISLGPHTVVAPNCKIGNFSMINRTVSIGHDSILGDFSTIAPGVTISGMVKIGRKVTIGVGATIINDVRIGDNSVVGAGSLVLNDVPENVVVIGTPAKVSKQN